MTVHDTTPWLDVDRAVPIASQLPVPITNRCSRAGWPETGRPLERNTPRSVTDRGKTVVVTDGVSDPQVRRCTVKVPASMVVVPSNSTTDTGPVLEPAGTVVRTCVS